MMKNQYQEMLARQQEEFRAFPMFFAFDEKQFNEGMHRFGLNPSDTGEVIAFAGTGGFYYKSDATKLHEMFDRHHKELQNAITADTTGRGFIYEMFVCELQMREYSYTGETEDTLNALGITPEELEASPQLRRGLELACKKVSKRDCFG